MHTAHEHDGSPSGGACRRLFAIPRVVVSTCSVDLTDLLLRFNDFFKGKWGPIWLVDLGFYT